MRVAVVDLGTNSTRLLVADVDDDEVRELVRHSQVTRLGDGVDAGGRLSDDAMRRVFDTLARYRDEIDQCGAERVVAVATSAMRDAANGEQFREQLHERYGIDARTIPGEEEARLTFLGATSNRADRDDDVMVVDIGGGSTEFVVGRPGGEPGFHVSTRCGSVRQSERHIEHDPPTAGELGALAADVRRIVEENVPDGVRQAVDAGIAVAGTATSLAAIDLQLDPYDPERVHGHRLAHDACREILQRLASKALPERREVTGLHPDRAPTIVAGATILVEAMEAFGLRSIEVSEADILHGAALTAAR